MNDVPHDGKSAGEVVVRAPWLTQGYLKNPDASRGAVARRLAAHRRHRRDRRATATCSITDRIKDVIKTGGEWISSLELEDVDHASTRRSARWR